MTELARLTITDTTMASNTTRHHAERLADGWRVSWLPDRRLTQSQAITAMTIAQYVHAHELTAHHPLWPHIDGWAAELGLTGPTAVSLIAAIEADTLRPFDED